MKASSRKIFKKIGAGLMLGLSLFNLGASWNKAEGWNIAKRSKKLRVKERDQVDIEMAMLAEVAEEEAEKVIKKRSSSQQEQVLENVENNFAQKVYRISAMGVLGVALGFFATSMIFNSPFALGKGLLSLLPGASHLAVFSLSINEKEISVVDDLTVLVNLDSAGKRVDKIKLVISYNPNLVSFENYISSITGWEIRESQVSNNKRELIALIDEDYLDSKIFSKEELIKINFNPKSLAVGQDLVFSVNQTRSLVVSKENGCNKNILGDTKGVKVFISEKNNQIMRCQKVEDLIGTIDFWKNFVQGDPLKPRNKYWQKFDDSNGMLCAHNGDYIYMTIVVPDDQKIDIFKIKNNQYSQKIEKPEYFWEEGNFKFYLYQISSKGITADSNIEIEIESEFFNKKQWPIDESGKIILE